MAYNYICDKVCDKCTDEDIALSLTQTEVEISEIIRYVQHNLTNIIVVCIPNSNVTKTTTEKSQPTELLTIYF